MDQSLEQEVTVLRHRLATLEGQLWVRKTRGPKCHQVLKVTSSLLALVLFIITGLVYEQILAPASHIAAESGGGAQYKECWQGTPLTLETWSNSLTINLAGGLSQSIPITAFQPATDIFPHDLVTSWHVTGSVNNASYIEDWSAVSFTASQYYSGPQAVTTGGKWTNMEWGGVTSTPSQSNKNETEISAVKTWYVTGTVDTSHPVTVTCNAS